MRDNNRRYGQPRTTEERLERHLALYGTTELPIRGFGLSEDEYDYRGAGIPLGDEDRRIKHTAGFGTDNLPLRGKGQTREYPIEDSFRQDLIIKPPILPEIEPYPLPEPQDNTILWVLGIGINWLYAV